MKTFQQEVVINHIDRNKREEINRFIDLPFDLYKNCPQWVPPLRYEMRQSLDENRAPFFKDGEAELLLAMTSTGKPVGRLAILNNRRYNEYNHEKSAFFYLFECVDDFSVADALFKEAFAWCRSRSLTKVIGSKGFSVFDGLGVLVEGFEYRPAFGIPYNMPYYPNLLEEIGFRSSGEMVSGIIDPNFQMPAEITRAAAIIQKRRKLKVYKFKSRAELKRVIPRLKEVYNASLTGTTGTMPLTDEEVKGLANQMLWFADPELIKIIFKDDDVVGFLFAYPDISAALQKTKGRLFPLGWLTILLELRQTKWININGAGMADGYRGLGGTALLFNEMFLSVRNTRYRYADVVQIGTENDRMLRELRDLGIKFHKKHRLYEYSLVEN